MLHGAVLQHLEGKILTNVFWFPGFIFTWQNVFDLKSFLVTLDITLLKCFYLINTTCHAETEYADNKVPHESRMLGKACQIHLRDLRYENAL